MYIPYHCKVKTVFNWQYLTKYSWIFDRKKIEEKIEKIGKNEKERNQKLYFFWLLQNVWMTHFLIF